MAGEGWITFIVEVAFFCVFIYVFWIYLRKEFGDRIIPDKSWLERLKGE